MNRQNCHDRTAEFFSVVEAFRKNEVGGGSINDVETKVAPHAVIESLVSVAPSNSMQQRSQFTQAAAHISKGIGDTSAKLQKLTKLAKTRSLFEDKSSEINEATHLIKADLQVLNSELELLHNYVAQSTNPNQASSVQSTQSNQAIIKTLKMQLATTTKSFAEVLSLRTKTLREQNSRRKNFESASGVKLPRREVRSFGNMADDSSVVIDIEKKESGGEGQTFAEQTQVVESTTSYLNSRAEAVEQIESVITELAGMYQKLATIVETQKEMTIRIDSNMETALSNVEAGHSELLTHYDRISSSQWLILKIFAVLLAFSVFFVMFVA